MIEVGGRGSGVRSQGSGVRSQELEFRVGVGDRSQGSGVSAQELGVGVGEWWWRSFMNFFNAETQRRRVAERDF